MTAVAVVAHSRKSLDGGLDELRKELAEHGVANPLWLEVDKSSKAPKQVEHALEKGAELIFAWGGDGMVQRCVDALAGSKAALAIVPAGTANLFASNVGIPRNIRAAVEIGMNGRRGAVDVGRMNGERFAVMAGLGFDARVIRAATPRMKNALGRMAYVWAATKNVRMDTFKAQVDVDGRKWYRGDASCILFGNVGRAFAGIEVFDDAHADDGLLEVGVASAHGILEWGRTFARSALSSTAKSPFVHVTKARRVDVKLDRKVLYELDGGDRTKRKSFRVEAEPTAVTVCMPAGKSV
jgi:YegS/Rv2252/BmrU family lipid kinase